ncbi:hypothetical protein HY480_02720 [Candidatus Uhrbacteria bacterium]|nr:hypothetical protein [Candidatus Uhrbacteria bacterium]
MRSDRANYERSNAILVVELDVTEEVRMIARRIRVESGETGHRQALAVELCDALCDGARIDVIRRVTISDARQWHKKHANRIVFRQYGYYHPVRRYVYITNRTAARGQLLSAGAFLETLLHEWVHHYDHAKLGLRSIHTSGFYARLRSLKEALGI